MAPKKTARVAPNKKARAGTTADSKIPYSRERGVLLSTREAAAHLGVTERHMERLRKQYGLPFVRIGGLYRFHIEDLDAYIATQRDVVQ